MLIVCLVTGDRRHLLPLGGCRGIRIVTPRQFLELVQGWGSPVLSPAFSGGDDRARNIAKDMTSAGIEPE
jgi:hypothetical protein